MATTPKNITPKLLEFCGKISPVQPFFVPVDGNALQSHCFYNVASQVKRDGGSIEYGWIIWEHPAVYVEAEFHAIWLKPDGAKVDITAKPDGETSILFLPDPVKTFDFDSPVPAANIRHAYILHNRMLDDFLELGDAVDRLRIRLYEQKRTKEEIGQAVVDLSNEHAAVGRRFLKRFGDGLSEAE